MGNFHDGYLQQGAPAGAVNYDLTLIADNTVVDITQCALLRLYSDSATATSRTFTLTSPTAGFTRLTILFMSGSSYTCELLSSGNCKLQSTWTPVQYESIYLQWDGTYWVELARKKQSLSNLSDFLITSPSNNDVLYYKTADSAWENAAVSGDLTNSAGAFTIANLAVTNAKVSATAAIAFTKLATLTSGNLLVGNGSNAAASVALSGDATLASSGAMTLAPSINVRTASITLSQANLTAMNGAAVNLIAAPGSGKIIIVDEIEWFHSYATAAYTNGGVVAFQYTGSTAIAKVAAAIVTEASSSTRFIKPSVFDIDNSTGSTPVSSAALVNLGVDITNATAAFAAGNASNVVKVAIRYHVYTLLT